MLLLNLLCIKMDLGSRLTGRSLKMEMNGLNSQRLTRTTPKPSSPPYSPLRRSHRKRSDPIFLRSFNPPWTLVHCCLPSPHAVPLFWTRCSGSSITRLEPPYFSDGGLDCVVVASLTLSGGASKALKMWEEVPADGIYEVLGLNGEQEASLVCHPWRTPNEAQSLNEPSLILPLFNTLNTYIPPNLIQSSPTPASTQQTFQAPLTIPIPTPEILSHLIRFHALLSNAVRLRVQNIREDLTPPLSLFYSLEA
ncbi:hypothetical protein BC829DRAFT_150037 [Chytridium lagenaria]|nr:hypothetical protein BC829DRAFT_150037 [Chytridium lagenaria]